MIIKENMAQAAEGSRARMLQEALDLCVRKTRENIKRLADEPKSAAWAEDGNYFAFKEGFFEIGNWTSSFFTGMALLAWRQTEDEYFLNQVLRLAPFYREKVFARHVDTHHDLGFLYSLYSVALYRLTGEKEHREVALRAAEVLSQRFNHKGNFIRAWGRMDEDDPAFPANLAIVDCLMNLPLLYWASNESGNLWYQQVAVQHADMFLKNFIRRDGSVFHAFRFDLQSGLPLKGDNYCGYSVDSYWARGVTWAIYGMALSYTYTRDGRYLAMALQLAKDFCSRLDGDVLPVWDFKLPAGHKVVRDTSAAAVAVCAFQELARHQVSDVEILRARNALMDRLCKADCLETNPAIPGILRNGQVGFGVNAFTSWGDYFLMEALCHELNPGKTFW